MTDNQLGSGAVIALDVGGTKIAGALLAFPGTILATAQLPTPAASGSAAVLDAMAEVVKQLRAQTGHEVIGLGLGAAGVIDSSRVKVTSATDTINGWAGTELGKEMTARTGLPVRAVNDVHAHGLGEATFGAGRHAQEVLLLAVGTGIGGSHLVNGQAQSGAHHVAGHMGHIDSPLATGIQCSCGRSGHVEAIAAGPAIHRHYLALGGDPDVADTRQVSSLAADGDETAGRALHTGGLAVGMAAASLVNVLDPDIVIISGGMAGAGKLWWNALREGFSSSVIDPLADVMLVPAELGNDAAFYGAASLFWPGTERKTH